MILTSTAGSRRGPSKTDPQDKEMSHEVYKTRKLLCPLYLCIS